MDTDILYITLTKLPLQTTKIDHVQSHHNNTFPLFAKLSKSPFTHGYKKKENRKYQ